MREILGLPAYVPDANDIFKRDGPKGSNSVPANQLLYVSPSSLKKFEPEQGGCPRDAWFAYVAGIRDPDTEPQIVGKTCHTESENYYRTGVRTFSKPTMKAWPWFAPRHEKIALEYLIDPASGYTVGSSNIPLKGYIDVVNFSGQYVSPMLELKSEPYCEINDWKFPGDLKYALNSSTAIADYQMALYGAYGLDTWGQDKIRLSLTYGPRKLARGRKVSVLVDRDRLAPTIEKAANTARKFLQIAQATDVSEVEPNLNACNSYGGCKRLPICPRTTTQIAIQIFGQNTMTMLNQTIAPAPVAPPAPTPAQHDPAIVARMAAIKAGAAAAAAPAPAPAINPEFVAAITYLQTNGMGCPNLLGDAATMFSTAAGGAAPIASGDCQGVDISDPSVVVTLAREVEQMPGKPAFQPPALVAPADAPASNPALAADPVESPPPGVTNPPAPAAAPLPPIGAAPASIATAAAITAKAMGIIAPAPAPTAPVAEAAVELAIPTTSEESAEDLAFYASIQERYQSNSWPKARKVELIGAFKIAEGRLRAGSVTTDMHVDYDQAFAQGAASVAATPVAAAVPADRAAVEVCIYVNCVASGATDLGPQIRTIADALAKQYGVEDLRAATNDSPLGYGKWKPALAALIRANLPAAGSYTLDTRGSEILECAAEALAPLTKARGY